jgi:protein O-mannosyl-transferase
VAIVLVKNSIPLPSPDQAKGQVSAKPATRQIVLSCVLLACACFLTYSRALSNGFVNYDDETYITQNRHVQAGLTRATIGWAFSTTDGGNWHPLTWISHALDVQMFGLSPSGHHFVSILLHTLNAVLLFLLLWKATDAPGRSLIVALLFELHPLNVECVAWAAERKSLLSALFFFVALAAYGFYLRRPSIQRYGLVALSFALGLMAKPMVITLPCVLLLLDFWPLRRIKLPGQPDGRSEFAQRSFSYLLLEKAPLFGLVVASAITTLIAQRSSQAIMPLGVLPLSWRLVNAISGYSLYLVKAIYPVGLAAFYPIAALLWWQFLASVLLLCAVSIWAWRERKHHRYVMVGWLWYLGTMVPVIGLVQVGSQAMADRYAYIPLIGIFVVAVWRLADLADSFSLPRLWRVVATGAVLLGFALLTWRQTSFWQNDLALWTHSAEVTTSNLVAEDNIGLALMSRGRFDESIVHFDNAIRIRSDEATPYIALTYVLRDRDPQQAIANGLAALSLTRDPRQVVAIKGNLGIAYNHIGDFEQASESFQEVLRLEPSEATAIMGLGFALLEQRAQKVKQDVERHPTAEGYRDLGSVYEQASDMERARQSYQKALGIDPKLSSAQQGLQRLAKPAP